MKTCQKCGKPKDSSEFKKNNNSKDGFRNKCIDCENKIKQSKKTTQYRKTRGLIKPSIPLKLTCQDGFGGYYRYDVNRLNEPLINSFICEHGILHRNKRYPILQVKSQNKQQMLDFAQCIDMSSNGVIHITREPGKEYLEMYVVNLMGKNIRQVIQ